MIQIQGVATILLTPFPGDLKVIHGQGMPSQRHHEPGDLYVKLSVKFPDHIDPDLIQHLEAALPPRKPLGKIDGDRVIEDVVLAEPEQRRRPAQRPHHDDDMDEDDGPHERVQCGNQ